MEKRQYFGVRKDVEAPKKFYPPVNRPDKEDFVFGYQSVLETLKSTQEIDKILLLKDSKNFQEIEELARKRNLPISKVPLEKLNRVTMKNHQGAIAFVSQVNFASLSNIVTDIFEKGEVPLILVLDRITDVRNFGAICRSAACSGVHAVVIPSRNAAQINGDAMKTSSGALNFVPVCREISLNYAVKYLQNSGFQTVACTEKGKKSIFEIDLTIPTAIIMGSEEDGISDDIFEMADAAAYIPMKGPISSLNVSVATGVVLFETLRQRG
jgi:23S rRNA (guanosine2251-2'-O)-methyltransferase